jgi:hypothetical protein
MRNMYSVFYVKYLHADVRLAALLVPNYGISVILRRTFVTF